MNELAEFVAELRDRIDECDGSHLHLGGGKYVWVHTPEQIRDWIDDAIKAWTQTNPGPLADEEAP